MIKGEDLEKALVLWKRYGELRKFLENFSKAERVEVFVSLKQEKYFDSKSIVLRDGEIESVRSIFDARLEDTIAGLQDLGVDLGEEPE